MDPFASGLFTRVLAYVTHSFRDLSDVTAL